VSEINDNEGRLAEGSPLARRLLDALLEVMAMVIRFKESVRVRVWGRELSNFRKGEIHAVPTAVAGVLLAQGCAEPVADDSTPELRRAS
jgi:hypothetical protein